MAQIGCADLRLTKNGSQHPHIRHRQKGIAVFDSDNDRYEGEDYFNQHYEKCLQVWGNAKPFEDGQLWPNQTLPTALDTKTK